MRHFLLPRAMWGWAVRDLARHWFFHMVLLVVIVALFVALGVWMLLGDSIANALTLVMARSPAVVVRRVAPTGWQPISVDLAVARAAAVAGVIDPRPRVWGVAATPAGAMTVVGVGEGPDGLPDGMIPPRPGQALAGPGIIVDNADDQLTLQAVATVKVSVIGRLPRSAAMAVHDVLIVHADDARRLLGLSADQASDLAIDVFHESEIDAVCDALVRAFPWPVHMDKRPDALRRMRFQATRTTGMGWAAGFPMLAAFALFVLAVGIGGHGRQWELGLYKAMGWTGSDLVRLRVYQALLVFLPALSIGSAVVYGLLYLPAVTWVAGVFFDWSGPSPALYLSVKGAAGALALAAVAVGLPYLSVSLWLAWQGVRRDPGELLIGGQ